MPQIFPLQNEQILKYNYIHDKWLDFDLKKTTLKNANSSKNGTHTMVIGMRYGFYQKMLEIDSAAD